MSTEDGVDYNSWNDSLKIFDFFNISNYLKLQQSILKKDKQPLKPVYTYLMKLGPKKRIHITYMEQLDVSESVYRYIFRSLLSRQ